MLNKKTTYGYLLILPPTILMAALILFPVLKTIYQSFFDIRIQGLLEGAPFIGLRNYINMAKDDYFLQSLKWTIELTFYSVVIQTMLATALALLMKKKFFGQGFVRAVILLPWAIPIVIAGMMWSNIFGAYGVLNTLLVKIGLILEPINFLGQTETAKTAIIIADAWKSTPYMSLLILAGLMGISDEFYEAAKIDGASKIQEFWHITLPLLRQALSVVIMFRLISAMKSYGLVVSMTSGGPGGTTETAAMYTINAFFRFGKIGYGSALAVVMLIVSLLISLMFLKTLMTKVDT